MVTFKLIYRTYNSTSGLLYRKKMHKCTLLLLKISQTAAIALANTKLLYPFLPLEKYK